MKQKFRFTLVVEKEQDSYDWDCEPEDLQEVMEDAIESDEALLADIIFDTGYTLTIDKVE